MVNETLEVVGQESACNRAVTQGIMPASLLHQLLSDADGTREELIAALRSAKRALASWDAYRQRLQEQARRQGLVQKLN